jgi:AraC-like DNA-binding protein
VEGDSAMLGFAVHGAGEAADQIVDGAAAIEFNILRELCGPDWRPTEILFAHGEPEDVRPFRRYFRAPLRFGAQHTGPVFPAHWLRRRLAGDDPGLSRLLQKQLEALEGRYGDDFPEQVRRVLGTSLLSGPTRVDQVAALFGMHSRTLNRRLHAFGTTFKHLVEQGRFEIARQLLEQSGKDMSEIAAVLGYSEPSAFTRAFRRWSGLTPYLWRRERRAGDSRRA